MKKCSLAMYRQSYLYSQNTTITSTKCSCCTPHTTSAVEMVYSEPVVKTIARLPGCWAITSCQARFLYVACHIPSTRGGYIHRISPTGGAEVLPMHLSSKSCAVAVSPNEDALYVGTDDGRILVHYSPWTDAPYETLLDGVGCVTELKACTEG
jgi:hypothetical protein